MKIVVFAAILAAAFAASSEVSPDLEQLKKLAEESAKKLEAEGKGTEAEDIRLIATEISNVAKHLAGLNPTTELSKAGIHALNVVLRGLVLKLESQLKKTSGSFYESTKDDLISDASQLRVLAQKEIEKLKDEGKNLLAAEIQVLDTKLQAAEKQLEGLKQTTESGQVSLQALAAVVKGLETKLQAELKKLGGAFYDSTKDQLSHDANRLRKLAQDEIKKLEAEGKQSLANGLQVLERDIATVERHLQTLTPDNEVGKLGIHAVETVLKGLEAKLEAELKSLAIA